MPMNLEQETMPALALRTAYLRTEATVRTIGFIYTLKGVLFLILISVNLYHNLHATLSVQERPGADLTWRNIVIAVLVIGTVMGMVIGTGLFLGLGRGLRKLNEWPRWIIIVLNSLILIGIGKGLFETIVVQRLFPITAMLLMSLVWCGLGLAIVVFLLLPATDVVCSKHYRFVVSETGEIQPKFGVRDKILLAMFFLGIMLMVASALTS